MNIQEIKNIKELNCSCKKEHKINIDDILIGKNVLNQLPEIIKRYGKHKAFILTDINTYKVAGERVLGILNKSGISYTSYTLPCDMPEPDEKNVGSVIMHYDASCDIFISVGSGVINDIGKIVSNVSKVPYIVIGTAPSMDGYASATSSMTRDGLKVSIPTRCADVIIGDTTILCNAPMKMLISGLGDMLAKYISILEWRISQLITDEYYCEDIAKLVRGALKKCIDNAEGLLNREEAAVEAVFEGLVVGGLAMNYAGLSRPASGVEHYISHIWDILSVESNTTAELHGIQCAVGTLISLRLYEKIKQIKPDKQKALDYVNNFDYSEWSKTLREFLGNGASTMIDLEEKEQKYNKKAHCKRLEIIFDNWEKLIKIIEEELPEYSYLEGLYNKLGIPATPQEIGIDNSILPITFKATKDIRDKYILSRLCWDLGIIDEII